MANDLVVNVEFPLIPCPSGRSLLPGVTSSAGLCAAYAAALEAEIAAVAPDFAAYRVAAVRIAGSTPGLMTGAQIRALLQAIERNFAVADGTELLMGLEPGRVSADFLENVGRPFRLRPHLPLASALADELCALGRPYGYGAFREVADLLSCYGVDDFGVDLLYGIPRQTPASLATSIGRAAELGARRVGLFPLEVAAGTELAAWVAEAGGAVEGDARRELFRAGRERLESLGFAPHTARRFALPDAQSAFWEAYAGGAALVGIGLGARSSFEDLECVNTRDLKAYVAHPDDPAVTVAACTVLDQKAQLARASARAALRGAGEQARAAGVTPFV